MREHAYLGYQILRKIPFLHEVADIVYSHQERYDGSGYPASLRGDQIPLESRILAVADAYDAMVSRRRYRTKEFSHGEAIGVIRQSSGTQFDPAVVEALCRVDEREILGLYGKVPEPSAAQAVVVTCGKCGARFRVDGRKIPPTGARVRCLKCGEPLVVRNPGAAAAAS